MITGSDAAGPALRSVKEHAVANLEANGIMVFRAAAAVDYILKPVEGGVVKSRINAVKEIGLVEALEQKGIRVVETDPGGGICQLATSRPATRSVRPCMFQWRRLHNCWPKTPASRCRLLPGRSSESAGRACGEQFRPADAGISGAGGLPHGGGVRHRPGRRNYVSLITGPSSTGDIQGQQVFGTHGPKRVTVIFLDNGRRRCLEEGLAELLVPALPKG